MQNNSSINPPGQSCIEDTSITKSAINKNNNTSLFFNAILHSFVMYLFMHAFLCMHLLLLLCMHLFIFACIG